MMRPIADSFRFSHFIMNPVTGDITEEDAVRRARGGDGASIAWIVGHLCHFRYETMKRLGVEKPNSFAATFGEGGATDASGYPPLEELRADWSRIHAELEQVMESVTDEQLTARLSGSGTPHGEERVVDAIVFFMWHESYHTGQLGTIRKELGYPATADLAVKATGGGA
jgi:uncharacterized damage-inducible protein DinB